MDTRLRREFLPNLLEHMRREIYLPLARDTPIPNPIYLPDRQTGVFFCLPLPSSLTDDERPSLSRFLR